MSIIHDKNWWAKYREKNRIWLRVYARRWHHKTKEFRAYKMAEYRNKNRDRLRELHVINSKKRRLEILSMLGSYCVQCGFNDYRALQIDHVNGGGSKERKFQSHSNSYKFWKVALVERKNDYQLLCANCNWIKRYENKELFLCR